VRRGIHIHDWYYYKYIHSVEYANGQTNGEWIFFFIIPFAERRVREYLFFVDKWCTSSYAGFMMKKIKAFRAWLRRRWDGKKVKTKNSTHCSRHRRTLHTTHTLVSVSTKREYYVKRIFSILLSSGNRILRHRSSSTRVCF